MDPLGTRSSSLTKETASLHGTVLPCGSFSSATTQVCRLPSSVMITSGRSASFGGVLEEPQPRSNVGIKPKNRTARDDIATLQDTADLVMLGRCDRCAGLAAIDRDDIGCIS